MVKILTPPLNSVTLYFLKRMDILFTEIYSYVTNYFFVACAEMAVFLLPVQNLILSSFSSVLISYKLLKFWQFINILGNF